MKRILVSIVLCLFIMIDEFTAENCIADTNKCYDIITKEPLEWYSANEYCENHFKNGSLVSIRNADENSYFIQLVQAASISTNLWIGGFRIGGSKTYQWIDDLSNIDYSNFAPGQPSPDGYCIQICIGADRNCTIGAWTATKCVGLTISFICEYRASVTSQPTTISISSTTPAFIPTSSVPIVSTSTSIPTSSATPTPRPTPPNPCNEKKCTTFPQYAGKCRSNGGIIKCHCPGNLDDDSCGKVSCISPENGGSIVDELGPFWSPGYNSLTKQNSGYSKNMNCLWIMAAPAGLTINMTANYYNVDGDSATLEIRTSIGNTLTLSSDYTSREYHSYLNERLQLTVKGAETVTFIFKTGAVSGGPTEYFDIAFAFV